MKIISDRVHMARFGVINAQNRSHQLWEASGMSPRPPMPQKLKNPGFPDPWSLVSGAWSLVPGRWLLAPGRWSLVPGPWFLAHGSWPLVPGPWSQALVPRVPRCPRGPKGPKWRPNPAQNPPHKGARVPKGARQEFSTWTRKTHGGGVRKPPPPLPRLVQPRTIQPKPIQPTGGWGALDRSGNPDRSAAQDRLCNSRFLWGNRGRWLMIGCRGPGRNLFSNFF